MSSNEPVQLSVSGSVASATMPPSVTLRTCTGPVMSSVMSDELTAVALLFRPARFHARTNIWYSVAVAMGGVMADRVKFSTAHCGAPLALAVTQYDGSARFSGYAAMRYSYLRPAPHAECGSAKPSMV